CAGFPRAHYVRDGSRWCYGVEQQNFYFCTGRFCKKQTGGNHLCVVEKEYASRGQVFAYAIEDRVFNLSLTVYEKLRPVALRQRIPGHPIITKFIRIVANANRSQPSTPANLSHSIHRTIPINPY